MVFYELVRRLGLLFAPDLVPLPTIDELRAQLYRDPYIQKVEAIFFFNDLAKAIRRWTEKNPKGRSNLS